MVKIAHCLVISTAHSTEKQLRRTGSMLVWILQVRVQSLHHDKGSKSETV